MGFLGGIVWGFLLDTYWTNFGRTCPEPSLPKRKPANPDRCWADGLFLKMGRSGFEPLKARASRFTGQLLKEKIYRVANVCQSDKGMKLRHAIDESTPRPSRRRGQRRKQPVVASNWPRIRRRTLPSGKEVYQVDARAMLKGRPMGARLDFETLEDAKAEAKRIRDRHRIHGGTASISAASMDDAQFALRLLQRHKCEATLTDAVNAYLETRASVRHTSTVEKLAESFLASKERDGASEGYLKDLRLRLRHLCASIRPGKVDELTGDEVFGKKMVDELTGDELVAWIKQRGPSAGSRANYRRVLDVFLNYAVENGYAARNPLDGRKRPSTPILEKPGILSVEELKKLLAVADKRILPALVIGAFAGLRPQSEIKPLQWEDIDLERVIDEAKSKKAKPVYKSWGTIHVKSGATKLRHDEGGGERFPEISENLWHWLTLLKPAEGGPVLKMEYNYFYELRQAASEKAGIAKWPHDALRHSAGSYHFAFGQDEAKTMTMLGHASVRTFRRHYRRAMPKSSAEPYWQIFPPSEKARGKATKRG